MAGSQSEISNTSRGKHTYVWEQRMCRHRQRTGRSSRDTLQRSISIPLPDGFSTWKADLGPKEPRIPIGLVTS